MSPPDNPWQLLGLDPKGASERDVKRAYARLLKIHRPDTDPEGFQKLHAAYQMALHLLQNPDASGWTGVDSSVEANATEVRTGIVEVEDQDTAHELDGEFAGAAARLAASERAFQESNDGELRTPSQDFESLRKVVREKPGLGRAWAEVLVRIFPGPEGLACLLEPGDLLIFQDTNAQWMVEAIVSVWLASSEDHDKVDRLAEMLIGRGGNCPEGDQVYALHSLALITAFLRPACSARLIDALYELLAPRDRGLLAQVESRQAAGRLFQRLALEERRFWQSRLYGQGEDFLEWESPQAIAALASLNASFPPYWDGWGMVRQIVPLGMLERSFPASAPAEKLKLPLTLRLWNVLNKSFTGPRILIALVIAGQFVRFFTDNPKAKPAYEHPVPRVIRFEEVPKTDLREILPDKNWLNPKNWSSKPAGDAPDGSPAPSRPAAESSGGSDHTDAVNPSRGEDGVLKPSRIVPHEPP